MIEVGRLCVKIAGRDAGRECVVVDILDSVFVLIDGNVRRRKCNIAHLEPMQRTVKIKKNASHAEVKAEFKKLKLAVWETKPKGSVEKPKKLRGKKKEKLEGKKTKVKAKIPGKKKPKSESLEEKTALIKEKEESNSGKQR